MTAKPVSLEEYALLAKQRAPDLATLSDRAVGDERVGGGTSGPSLFLRDNDPVSEGVRNNIAAFAEIGLRPRVLVDIAELSLSTEVLGERISLPVMLAPASSHGKYHPDGELAAARAAGGAGTLFGVSTLSTLSLERIAAAAGGPAWFQLFMLKNRDIAATLVRRAERAGYRAIVLSVDNTGGHGAEQNSTHPRMVHPERYANFRDEDYPEELRPLLPRRGTWFGSKSKSFVWEDLAWLRSVTRLPIVIKGVQTAEDAWLCAKHGAAGLVVSNHGGHALRGATGTLKSLPEVVSAVGDRVEVFLDGGVRKGTDVLKALALGARAVLIGRPYIWALVADGEAGVRGVLEILRLELGDAMGFCGVTDVRTVGPWLVNQPANIGVRADLGTQLAALARLLATKAISDLEHTELRARLLAAFTPER